MQGRRKGRTAAAVLWGLGLLVPAVALAGEETTPVLRVGAANSLPSLVLFVGVEKGIFLKNGVDVKLRVFGTGPEMTKALQAGDIDMAAVAMTNLPVALERGFQVRGIVTQLGDGASTTHDNMMGVVVRPGAGIERLADLAGKKVGVTIGGTADLYLTAALKRGGVARDAVGYVNVPPGNMVAILQGGGVDAVATWEPFVTMASERVAGTRLLVRGGGYVCFCSAVNAPPQLIEARPDVLRRFVMGMAEAAHYTRTHLDEAAEISTRWVPGLEAGLARKVIPYTIYDPRLTPQTYRAFDESVRILLEQKKMRAPFPAERVYEPRFIQQVVQERPEWFADLKPVP